MDVRVGDRVGDDRVRLTAGAGRLVPSDSFASFSVVCQTPVNDKATQLPVNDKATQLPVNPHDMHAGGSRPAGGTLNSRSACSGSGAVQAGQAE